MSVPGIVILIHNHCISMGSHWFSQLNTDIAKRTTPYGGIATLGTVKYRSDVICMYEDVFLVFRMAAQVRFFQNSYSHQGIETWDRFSTFQFTAPCTGTLIVRFFRRVFSQKCYDLLIRLICYDRDAAVSLWTGDFYFM